MRDKLRGFQRLRTRQVERGFTLVEVLVVMVVIGVLSAIAIPAFLNQQKAARDTATVADVRNIAMHIQSGMIAHPDATIIEVTPGDHTGVEVMPETESAGMRSGEVTIATVMVGAGRNKGEFSSSAVTITKGTRIWASFWSDQTIRVRGFNPKGKIHTTTDSGALYDSAAGGMQSGYNPSPKSP